MFGKLSKMWKTTKVKLYGALVVPVLLYGSECWCLRRGDESRLLVAEMDWLCGILGRSRRDRIRNEKTREELGAKETVKDKIRKRRLTWFGHITRMNSRRLPTAALHGHVEGTRSRGSRAKTWMDNIKDLEERDMDISNAVDTIREREIWRCHVKASLLAQNA
jgi:hypothetical protein